MVSVNYIIQDGVEYRVTKGIYSKYKKCPTCGWFTLFVEGYDVTTNAWKMEDKD